jgi:hypothetical protein
VTRYVARFNLGKQIYLYPFDDEDVQKRLEEMKEFDLGLEEAGNEEHLLMASVAADMADTPYYYALKLTDTRPPEVEWVMLNSIAVHDYVVLPFSELTDVERSALRQDKKDEE